jgi:DNA repair exonuclease SbcCD nuclease subunit
MRFLHLADVHLDSAFASHSRKIAVELRKASRAAFEGSVETAIRERVDALLIAGDLFDGERLTVETERFLHETLSRLRTSGIQVVYATGNHDPGGGAGPASLVRWPDNVSLIRGPEPVTVEILRDGEPVGLVSGAGHASARVTEDLSRRFPLPHRGPPHVALLHSQVRGSAGGEGHEPYAPSDLAHLSTAGYDYWALGHVHLRQTLSVDPPIHYPGNPQGRNPRETGAKGALLVDLSRKESPRVDFIELGPVRWETLRVKDLEGEGHVPALARRLEREWRAARQNDAGRPGTRWIARIELEGPSPLHRQLATGETLAELKDALVSTVGLLDAEVRASGVRSLERVEDHVRRDDVLGETLRLVRDLAAAPGASPAEALGVSRDLLATQVDALQLDDYLRELLASGDALLLDALLRSADR